MRKLFLVSVSLIFLLPIAWSQRVILDVSERLYLYHSAFKVEFIQHRRFKHADIMSFLNQIGGPLSVKQVGVSVEGKAINMVSFGKGPTSVLLWSQMHGNEPTATMALMDILNFLEQADYEFDPLRNLLAERLTVHFIPMLNPDGADRFQRRNSQAIDINRDALRLQTPEGRTLKRMRDSLNADWGFNLHDQGRRTAVNDKPATISMLAPAFDEKRSLSDKREDAMQMIALMNEALQKYIRGQVGRYGDAFEPRAFGDNIQKWGTRTILIESGGFQGDREKQEIRRLNFTAIMSSLYAMTAETYEENSADQYLTIPENEGGLRDVIIKNIQLPESMGGHLTDLAFDFSEIQNETADDYYLRPELVDVGDLSTSNGYILHNAAALKVKMGKVFSERFSHLDSLKKQNLDSLVKLGYTDFVIDSVINPFETKYFPFRIHISEIDPGGQNLMSFNPNPSLLFYKENELVGILVNGYFFDPRERWRVIVAGMKKL